MEEIIDEQAVAFYSVPASVYSRDKQTEHQYTISNAINQFKPQRAAYARDKRYCDSE